LTLFSFVGILPSMIKPTYLVHIDGHNKYYIVKPTPNSKSQGYDCTYGGFGKSPTNVQYNGDIVVQKKIQEKLKKGYVAVTEEEFDYMQETQ